MEQRLCTVWLLLAGAIGAAGFVPGVGMGAGVGSRCIGTPSRLQGCTQTRAHSVPWCTRAGPGQAGGKWGSGAAGSKGRHKRALRAAGGDAGAASGVPAEGWWEQGMAMQGRVGGRAAAANSTRIQDVAEGALAANGDRRPEWLPESAPSWLYKTHHPVIQLGITLVLYAFHLLVLSKSSWTFPGQLIPNDKGAFQSIGLDSLAGLVVLGACVAARFAARVPAIPNILAKADPPWRVPREAKKQLGATTAYLLLAYVASGYAAVVCEQVLLLLSVYNVPLTIPTMRAWKVLMGHLMWVYMGMRILGSKHKPFFPPKGQWVRWRTESNWVWWVSGTYFVSALLFNAADLVNQVR